MNRTLITWLVILLWVPASYVISGHVYKGMKFRVNDLTDIPGAGAVMRSPAGDYYHVLNPSSDTPDGRKIFPELDPPIYDFQCLDCTLVSNEQLSRTRQFCVAGIPNQMPSLIFENPCKSSIPYGKSHNTIWAIFFVVPLVIYFFLRSSRRARSAYTKTIEQSRKNSPD